MNLLESLPKGFLLGDGGYGAIILSRGLAAGEFEELWNVTHPQEIDAIHRDFITAGSELVQANTLKANAKFLEKFGCADKVQEINQAGIEVARRAADEKSVFVVGSIGPIGELLEPYGDLTTEQAKQLFLEQANAMTAADGIFVETFVDIHEAEIAVIAAKTTGLPVVARMSFQANGATVMGVKPAQAAERLAAAGADVIGANCGIGPAELFPIIENWKKSYDGVIIAQPNAGMPQLIEGKTVFPGTPEMMAEYALRFRDIGVHIIGGCCGTRPDHIAAMARALRGDNNSGE